MNACNGQGGCKVSGKNACKGMNDCKGQGGCKVMGDKDSCKASGGCSSK